MTEAKNQQSTIKKQKNGRKRTGEVCRRPPVDKGDAASATATATVMAMAMAMATVTAMAFTMAFASYSSSTMAR